MTGKIRRTVFLDRDGVINENPPITEFVTSPEEFRLLAGVPEALHSLSWAGFLLVVVTNQSGVGSGKFTQQQLDAVNERMRRLLAEKGVTLDGIYVCPHPPGFECDCRKPAPGLLLQAARELDIDLPASYTVGDSARDIEAGQRAGTRTIFVSGNAYPDRAQAAEEMSPDGSFESLTDAARFILQQENERINAK